MSANRIEAVLEAAGLDRPGRREFLKIGCGAATAVAVGACSGAQIVRDALRVGPVDAFPSGSVTLIEDGPVLVGRDEGGLYAMSPICPHLGCAVRAEGERLPCPCHGSVFDLHGAVVRGPASRPLEHYRVTLDGDHVIVDTREVVDPATRGAVGA